MTKKYSQLKLQSNNLKPFLHCFPLYYFICYIYIQMSHPTRRVLPPGIDDDIVFGIMWIRVGVYKPLKPAATASHKVSIQFWGEANPTELYTSQNNPQTQQYEVKCPVTYFQKYLRDMKHNLKIEVENIGYVNLDLSNHLKKNIELTSKVAFERFKGFFEVIGKNNKKVGTVELELCSNFNPTIALRQLGEELNQNPKIECQAETIKSCKCLGQCKCKIDKITALDVIAVQKPELFNQFYEECKQRVSPKTNQPQYTPFVDQRIPNSLNSEPNKSPFDPKKYAQLMEKEKQPSIGQREISKKRVSEQVLMKQATISPKKGSKFPSVQKILTYSNLRLIKQSNDQAQNRVQQQQMKVKKIESINYPSSKDGIQSKEEIVVSRKEIPKDVDLPRLENKNNRPKKQQQNKQQPPPSLPPTQRSKPHAEHEKIKADVSISRVSEVKQVDDSASVDIQRDILSRVVHLNEQMQKQQKASPKKVPLNEVQQHLYLQSNFKNLYVNLNQGMPVGSKKKSSNMLLNMIFEINTSSVNFTKQSKFYISYRPYGQKQHLKVGPQFQPTITLMFPVGQPQIKKMNKIPFILQFWNAVTSELLGITKIDLAKIQHGFILEGRINELAIKTSLLPTVIHKGSISINNLLDLPIGQCYLQAHIGTTSQIQSYINSPKSQPQLKHSQNKPQIQRLQERIEEKKQVVKNQRGEGNVLDLTNLLHLIDSNPTPKILESLLSFMNLKKANPLQLQALLDNIGFKGGNPYKLLAFNNYAECKQLAICHQDYKRVRQILNQTIIQSFNNLSESTLNSFIRIVKNQSNFGVISKKEIKECLQSIGPWIDQCLPQLVEEDSLLQWISTKGKRALKQITFSSTKSLFSFISQLFLQQCHQIEQNIETLISQSKGTTMIDFQKLTGSVLRDDGHPLSRWAWIMLLHNIYQSFNQDFKDFREVNIVLVYNWFAQKIKQKQKEIGKREQQKKQEQRQQYKQTVINMQESIANRQIASEQPKSYRQPIDQKKETSNKENTNKQSYHQAEPSKIPQNYPLPQKNTYYQHKFVVTLQQLYTSGEQVGECQVSYKFPFEEHLITSKKIQLIRDKCKYKLISEGVHKFTINEPIELYFGENTLSIRVSINGHSYLYADVHPDELTSPGSSSKVVPIFSTEKEGMAGKLKLKIEYSKKQSQVAVVSRQTTQDIFLPKNGYLNYEIMATVEEAKIKQMFNIKQDSFYLQIILDLFGESKPLAPHYPPIHSNLTSDFTSPLIVTGSYKISLNPQVLQHLRSACWTARLLLVYYSKQKGNYQKKEVVIATVSAPLLSAIREQGISGQYAFKNKLGMFVSLAQAKIKYQKTSKTSTNMPAIVKEHSKQNVWIVLDFSEIINFQGDLNWIKFEIINQGKRFTTEKTTIRDCGFFNLQKRCLMLHLSYEDFYSLKIVPIKLITPHQQFGIDLNLRHIAKNIHKQKYSVDSHYFIVLDDKTQPVKIRIGLKLYVFRGPAQISAFVQALTNNTNRSVVDIVQKEDDYNSLIEGLKQQLKLSHKSIDQFLTLVLDRRRKERLPRSFFTCTIEPALDTSPILCSSSGDVQALGQQLKSEALFQEFLDYVEQMGIVLQNLRGQLLQRYKFCKLNENKIDQNVEYLGLHDQIDVLVLLKKIKVQDKTENNKITENETRFKHVRLSIIKGFNFHLLYNGIKPNCLLKIPQFGLETQVIERTSQPIFNEHINIDITSQNKNKSIKIQAYHVPSDHSEEIMIGEGTLTITESLKSNQISSSKIYRAVINSLMSNRQQASLDIKVQVLIAKNESYIAEQQEQLENEDQIGDSVIEDAVQRIKKFRGLQKKAMLFQSSDQD